MKEVGFRRFDDSYTWAAKTNAVEKDGSFYLYGNDQARGLDVYRFDAGKAGSGTGGDTWMGAAQAARVLGSRDKIDLSGYEMLCLPGKTAQKATAAAEALRAAHHR